MKIPPWLIAINIASVALTGTLTVFAIKALLKYLATP